MICGSPAGAVGANRGVSPNLAYLAAKAEGIPNRRDVVWNFSVPYADIYTVGAQLKSLTNRLQAAEAGATTSHCHAAGGDGCGGSDRGYAGGVVSDGCNVNLRLNTLDGWYSRI